MWDKEIRILTILKENKKKSWALSELKHKLNYNKTKPLRKHIRKLEEKKYIKKTFNTKKGRTEYQTTKGDKKWPSKTESAN